MGRYWNGYQWVEDPKMASLRETPIFDHSDVRDALVEAELNPPDETGEHVPVEVALDDTPIPEQPTPNLADHAARLERANTLTIDAIEQKLAEQDKGKSDVVISEDVRARLRAELGIKVDGSSSSE
jgi:hypothetical protein